MGMTIRCLQVLDVVTGLVAIERLSQVIGERLCRCNFKNHAFASPKLLLEKRECKRKAITTEEIDDFTLDMDAISERSHACSYCGTEPKDMDGDQAAPPRIFN
ncbi:uncharacterized protein [Rutidosis leptorrhynchoides]|uniref:uncharacterized protein isoform X3 n=1 Tax=Rutidosis leptorrhynchoides TaxID=125765 RepID=UPI003A993F34